MAFNGCHFSSLTYANGFTLWHYRTEDTWEDLTHDYFDGAKGYARHGDYIYVNLSDGNFTAWLKKDEQGVLTFVYD